MSQENYEAMIIAINRNNVKQLKGVIQEGANVNAVDTDGWTPVHWAARWGHIESLRVLIQECADVNIQNKKGESPLHLAAENGYVECLHELIKSGANIETKDKEGWIPLISAAFNNQEECVKILEAERMRVILSLSIKSVNLPKKKTSL